MKIMLSIDRRKCCIDVYCRWTICVVLRITEWLEEHEVCGDFYIWTSQGAKLPLQHHPGWLTSQPFLCRMEAQLTHLEFLTAQVLVWEEKKINGHGQDRHCFIITAFAVQSVLNKCSGLWAERTVWKPLLFARDSMRCLIVTAHSVGKSLLSWEVAHMSSCSAHTRIWTSETFW